MTDAIAVTDLSKRYRIYKRRTQSLKELLVTRSRGQWEDLWALRDISFRVPPGQTLGLIGENGSGKSTLLKLLVGILHPDAGSIETRGRVSSLLELGAGFHPEYTGRENVFLYGALLGLRTREVRERYEEIVEFSELGSFLDYPVKNYSSGMYMRLGFAVAVHLQPDVLLIDEILAVGDTAFQQKCYQHLNQLKRSGRTIVLVSHDLDSVTRFCERAIWLDHGRLMADGPSDRTVEEYLDVSLNQERRGERHAGGAEVRITKVTFKGGDERQLRTFPARAPLTVEVEYEALRPVPNASLNFTVFRTDGVRIFDAPTDKRTFDIAPGRHVARLRLASLPLIRGAYQASLSISNPATGEMYEYHDRAYPFRVSDSLESSSLVLVDYEWELGERQRRARASR